MFVSRRVAALAATAVTALAGAAVWATGPADAAAAGCAVNYRITNQWTGGFGADVTVTNLGDAVNGWTLTWTFGTGQSVGQAWNATVTQSGTAVTARNAGYNGSVPTNGSASFGFNGTFTSANPVPSAFTLNGTTCTGSTTPGPSSPAPSSPAPSSPAPSSPAAVSPTTVWIAGDSTVANSSGTNIVGWGRELGGYLTGNATVVNSAIGGRSVQTWLYDPNVTDQVGAGGECVLSSTAYSTRWQAMLNATSGMKAGDYLFIQFGINDGSTTCPRHVGSARFKELLTVMVNAAKQRGAQPVLVTSPAAITCSGSTAVANRGFLTETFAVGTATGTPVIDLHKASYTLYNRLGFCPFNGDYTSGPVGAFFADDHTHFEAAGARQIAGLVATAVRDQNISLKRYLR
jgi:lysophospholipase L1-like esterase